MHPSSEEHESDDNWESDSDTNPLPLDSEDSDAEIQEAFAKGILKPGLNLLRPYDDTAPKKKTFVNNVAELQRRLEEIKTDLPWIERLDLISEQAPLAPELAHQISEHKLGRENQLKQGTKTTKKKRNAPPVPTIEEDPIHNDFKREMTFFRQAQSAAMRGLDKLKQLAIPSKRPTDYFAQMVKTDNHMQKVRKLLTRQKVSSELSEKARELRQQRKMSKEVQKDVLQKRQSEKKKLMEAVKRYRKGHKDALEYLENDLGDLGLKGTTEMFDESKGTKSKSKGNKSKSPAKGNAQQSNRQKKMAAKKRDFKQKKFGFGGQKKRSKQNTRESTNMSRTKGKGKMNNKRPGKEARKTMKGKRR